MSYTERNASKSNGLADGPSEKVSFLTPFVNRDELYWVKRFKNQTCKKDFFQILFEAFRPVSFILQPMKNTYVFFKYKADFLINFVNRDELYWAKCFKNQTVWQNPAFEKSSFSNPFSQSRWGILSETHLRKTVFSNPFYQSRWAILSETVQRSNGLADGPSENTSFLINFVNRDELY